MVSRVARDRTGLLAAVLGLASVAIVFAAAGQRVPHSLLPRAPRAALAAVPHVNAVLSVAAIVVIAAGWRAARRGAYATHRRRMLAGLGLFGTFLALYLYRVSLLGPHSFPGPDPVYRYVYLPILAVHVLLAVVCLPLLYYVALLGETRTVEELGRTAHARVGRVAAGLWITSFALGVVVYCFLYVVY